MIDFAARTLSAIRWSRADITRFLGEFLTEPKPHVVFERTTRARGGTARLAPKTQLLYAGRRFFMNGEELRTEPRQRAALRELADRRALGAGAIARAGLAGLIYEWQRHGFVALERK
jgi:50S ribosomal protein L16 3-hydroxylase